MVRAFFAVPAITLEPGTKPDPVKATQAKRAAIEALVANHAPPPSNGIAVSFSIPIKARGVKGVLEEYDALETGDRTVPADWTLHDDVHTSGWGGARGGRPRKVLLYFHGGAYTLLSEETHRPLVLHLSRLVRAPAVCESSRQLANASVNATRCLQRPTR